MIKIIMLKNSIVYHHRREEEEGAEKKNEDAAASQIWRGAWVKELPLVHPKARLTHSSRLNLLRDLNLFILPSMNFS